MVSIPVSIRMGKDSSWQVPKCSNTKNPHRYFWQLHAPIVGYRMRAATDSASLAVLMAQLGDSPSAALQAGGAAQGQRQPCASPVLRQPESPLLTA